MSYQDEVLRELRAQKTLLIEIANQLKALADASTSESPNYRRKLSEYLKFDWSEINAEVVEKDASGGAIEVEWRLHRFLRRSGSGKFGKAIWFSRPTGQGENGVEYARLITFKDYEPEPLAAEITTTPTPQPPAPSPVEPSAAGPVVVEEVESQISNSREAMDAFYALAGDAINAGRIAWNEVNQLVALGDFTVALPKLRQAVAT